MKRILIIGLNFYPELTGIGKFTGEMAAYLSTAGYQVKVVTAPPYYPYWKIQPGYHGWQYRKEIWQGVEVYRCPLWVPKRLSGLNRILHLFTFTLSTLPVMIGQAFWHADLVMCIAPSLMNAPFASLLARISGASSWLHIQDFELDAASNLGFLPKNRRLQNFSVHLEHNIIDRFSLVSTISNRMMDRLSQKGIAREKIILFPNWVDPELIFPINEGENRLKKSFDLPKGQVIVLYSGNMGKKQGLEVLVEAARTLQSHSSITFIFCGDGATRLDLEKAASDLPNIKFLPLQPIETLNQLLNLADIHVLPQRVDAADLVMPSKLSGMLASGKVVIATANPGTELADVVSQFGVVVPPEDSDRLADAILYLANNGEERNRLGQVGLNWVKANWSKELVLHNLCLLIEQALESK
jgi:colanic acid biosynthesis glycosyl transferase WcaI